MQWVKFSEVPPGSQFKFGGQLFRKRGMNLAEEPDGTRIVFPSSTAVELVGKPGGRVKPEDSGLPCKDQTADPSPGPKASPDNV